MEASSCGRTADLWLNVLLQPEHAINIGCSHVYLRLYTLRIIQSSKAGVSTHTVLHRHNAGIRRGHSGSTNSPLHSRLGDSRLGGYHIMEYELPATLVCRLGNLSSSALSVQSWWLIYAPSAFLQSTIIKILIKRAESKITATCRVSHKHTH